MNKVWWVVEQLYENPPEWFPEHTLYWTREDARVARDELLHKGYGMKLRIRKYQRLGK